MKVIIIQEKGRNLDNQKYREGLSLARGFVDIGVEAVVWGLNYDNFSTPFSEIIDGVDAIILLENYESGNWIPDLSGFKGKKFFWSIDSHMALRKHQETEKKHKIDQVLCAVYGHDKYFENGMFFPNAVDSHLFYPKNYDKIYDIGFCGSYSNRKQWIDIIPNIRKDIWVLGDKMVNIINQYKIGFNRNVSVDINYRTFEYMAVKAMCLTNYTPGLEHLFELGEEVVVYGSEEDLLNKVKYFTENDEHRMEIALRGYERIMNEHTYTHRAQQIIEMI